MGREMQVPPRKQASPNCICKNQSSRPFSGIFFPSVSKYTIQFKQRTVIDDNTYYSLTGTHASLSEEYESAFKLLDPLMKVKTSQREQDLDSGTNILIHTHPR